MADLDSEFAFLVSAVRRSVDLLRAHLDTADLVKGGRGSALSGHVEHTLAGIDAKLKDAQQSFESANATEKTEYIKRARLLNSCARFMHKAIPWISAAAKPSLDLGALYFIDELGLCICGDKPDDIPNASAEFSTEWWPFNELYTSLGLTPQAGATPVVLNFPECEVSSHLLLPIYGHELGHTAVQAQQLVQKVLDAHTADLEFTSEFTKAREAVVEATGQTPREAGIALGWRLEWWITEMLCDQLAVQTLGPSFLLAFASFLLGDAWDDPGERHPPTCVRISQIVNHLVASKWDSELRARTPKTYDWLESEVASTTPKGKDAGTQFLLYAMERMKASISSIIAAYLGAKAYATTDFESQIEQITELTDCETLPAQLPDGHAVDRRNIMLAAWLSVLEPADAPQTLASAPADIRTQAFFAKAIEMSTLLSAWKASR